MQENMRHEPAFKGWWNNINSVSGINDVDRDKGGNAPILGDSLTVKTKKIMEVDSRIVHASTKGDRVQVKVKDNTRCYCYTILYSLYRVVSWYIVYAV